MNLSLKLLKKALLTYGLKVFGSFYNSIFNIAVFTKFWHINIFL